MDNIYKSFFGSVTIVLVIVIICTLIILIAK